MPRLTFYLLSLLKGFCFFVFTVIPVAADGDGTSQLLNPKEDRVSVWGIPPGQTRVWTEQVFSDENGNYTALCIENLIVQRIFPFASRGIEEGLFCLGNIKMIGVHEFAATGLLSSRRKGETSWRLNEIPKCTILVAGDSTPMPGMPTLTHIPNLHVVKCPFGDSKTALIGQFLTTDLSPGTSVEKAGPIGGENELCFVVRSVAPIVESIIDLSPRVPR